MYMKRQIVPGKMKKYAASVLCALTIFSVVQTLPVMAAPVDKTVTVMNRQAASTLYLQRTAWEPEVKQSINDFLKLYGKQSANYKAADRPYAVFDFDNTTSVMDVEEQLMIWQLDHLAFAIAPNQMMEVLRTGIPAEKLSLTYGADDGEGRQVRIQDGIRDASAAYSVLYKQGLVTPQGKEFSAAVKNSPEFKEFKAKMRWLYDAIGETMDASVSYPWVTYWYTGMTPNQVYQLAYRCDSWYGDPAKGQTWSKGSYQSPAELKSQAGNVSVSYKLGITVTPEIKELYNALNENGIDTWIDSASPLDVVRAAVDYFQIPGVDGIVGMTNRKDRQGRYINAYDYKLHAQTQGVGKSQAIDSVIAPRYKGQGPVFTAMDSQGDFNFCTEYKNTKAVLVLNRKRTDDAALCAGIAVWQKKKGVSLAQANKNGDTLYLLQGRNENTGTLWPDDKTLLLGKKDKAYLSDKAQKVIQELDAGKSIAEVLKENTKLKDYQGYKTR
jgi:hypothetical protein